MWFDGSFVILGLCAQPNHTPRAMVDPPFLPEIGEYQWNGPALGAAATIALAVYRVIPARLLLLENRCAAGPRRVNWREPRLVRAKLGGQILYFFSASHMPIQLHNLHIKHITMRLHCRRGQSDGPIRPSSMTSCGMSNLKQQNVGNPQFCLRREKFH